MARKTAQDLRSVNTLLDEAIEDWKVTSELKGELAREAYDAQDEETQAAIDRIIGTLRQHATGYITVQLHPPHGNVMPVKVENKYLDYNLFWLGMEVAKDLAIVGIRLVSFEFPPSLCSNCAADIIPEKKKVKR